jgi:hypothetical protein
LYICLPTASGKRIFIVSSRWTGCPQPGQLAAWLEMLRWHTAQLISAIALPPRIVNIAVCARVHYNHINQKLKGIGEDYDDF